MLLLEQLYAVTTTTLAVDYCNNNLIIVMNIYTVYTVWFLSFILVSFLISILYSLSVSLSFALFYSCVVLQYLSRIVLEYIISLLWFVRANVYSTYYTYIMHYICIRTRSTVTRCRWRSTSLVHAGRLYKEWLNTDCYLACGFCCCCFLTIYSLLQ